MHRLSKAATAEFIGTFWLVLGGCGSALLAATFPQYGIGFAGTAFAFGLTALTMGYTIGPISGCHLNPAVTIGFAIANRTHWGNVLPYIIAQLLGAITASAVLAMIASGKPGFNLIASGFAANGFNEHSPGGYSLPAALLCETILTSAFVFVALSATHPHANVASAPIAIGLCLTLVHLISIPVTNTSVNPARSTGPALFVGDWALAQLWVFWAAPLVGAAMAGVLYPALYPDHQVSATPEANPD